MYRLFVIIIHNLVFQCDSSLRVYGGRDAQRGEFPYVVRIETHTTLTVDRNDEYFQRCTGAALTSSWILSAAHCAHEEEFEKENIEFVARYNSYFPKELGNTKIILEIKKHPSYYYHSDPVFGSSTFNSYFKNDICLFRSEGIVVDSYGKLSPVEYSSLIGHEAITLGFGVTNASEYDKPLQVLKGMLYDCNKEKSTFSHMLCLASQCGVKSTICGGDSGGPIIHASGIVGVNSMADGNCDENSQILNITYGTPASVITMVSPNFDWILNIVANKSLNNK